MMRGSREELIWPEEVRVFTPCALYVMVVSTLSNCEWLNVLYASARNCTASRSLIWKFLNTEVFQLFTPGPRMALAGMSPMFRMLRAGQPLAVQELGLMATRSAEAPPFEEPSDGRSSFGRIGIAHHDGPGAVAAACEVDAGRRAHADGQHLAADEARDVAQLPAVEHSADEGVRHQLAEARDVPQEVEGENVRAIVAGEAVVPYGAIEE